MRMVLERMGEMFKYPGNVNQDELAAALISLIGGSGEAWDVYSTMHPGSWQARAYDRLSKLIDDLLAEKV